MCGIAGVISGTPLCEEDIRAVQEMTVRLSHRGPDSSGFLQDTCFAMGMRRLSIIDLMGGDQPISNESEEISIVCNGEIYNHDDLRSRLQTRGHHFRSRSDVETIVHLYEEHGPSCVRFLRGMFAFALWDRRKNQLFLARDRIGEKPLHLYHDTNGKLWFSSEIRSLLAGMRKHSIGLSPKGVNLFLTFQYVPEPMTLLEGVSLLPAGHFLVLTPERIHEESEPYWTFLDGHECDGDPTERVRRVLDEACYLMGTADVPVGVALSGGIDSSLVAALTAKHYPGQIHAFTVGYPGLPESDERPIARGFAEHLGVPFTEVIVPTEEVVNSFTELVKAMDTPVADIAAHGYYAVSRAARFAGVPVLLSGMGGDEFFWGYDWVREAVFRNSGERGWKHLPSWVKRIASRIGQKKPTFFEVHDELRMGDLWSRDGLAPQAMAALPESFWLKQASLEEGARMDMAVSELLIRTWLRSNCLTLADRMSMAHSVEMRLPLLDVEAIHVVTGLRNAGLEDWKKPHKWLLIEAFGDLLPPEIIYRKKQGFTPPVENWLSQITEAYSPLLYDGALAKVGILDGSRLRSLIRRASPSFTHKLVLLEVWTRLVVERSSVNDVAFAVSHPEPESKANRKN
jgi:asparagine synthase (glutamine-hydrolysing)